jgi:hypothetical protein
MATAERGGSAKPFEKGLTENFYRGLSQTINQNLSLSKIHYKNKLKKILKTYLQK